MFVFFDIECASVNRTTAKICVFGYVLCDENFNIIKKEDILINPKGGFHLTDRKGDRGIVLPYAYEEFKNHPPFPKVYNYIKSLLEDKENIVLGHSTMNDVKYLNLETKRFKLPPFKFNFSDSQLIYNAYIGNHTRQMGLEHIATELGVEFTPHRAVDDAYATMRVVEAMCKAKGCSYFKLIDSLGMKNGRISNFTLIPPTSAGERKYQRDKQSEKAEIAKKHVKLFNYISRKKIRKSGRVAGKVFTFSREIENDLEIAKSLIDKIYSEGGSYSQHMTHSNYYIANTDDESPRMQNAQKLENLTVMNVDGLEGLLNG